MTNAEKNATPTPGADHNAHVTFPAATVGQLPKVGGGNSGHLLVHPCRRIAAEVMPPYGLAWYDEAPRVDFASPPEDFASREDEFRLTPEAKS